MRMLVSCFNLKFWVELFLMGHNYKFANQVLLIKDVLIFHSTIVLCYFQQIMALQSHVPSPRTWVVCELAIKMLAPIITRCVTNKNHAWKLIIWKHFEIYCFHMS
jgi:hypothetical protein